MQRTFMLVRSAALRIFSNLPSLPEHSASLVVFRRRLKQSLHKAFLFALSITLLLVGQSALLSIPAQASDSTVNWPVDIKTQHWKIISGYNHWAAGSSTLDHGGTVSPLQGNPSQLYGFDLARTDGVATVGSSVYSPADGTVESQTYPVGGGAGVCVVVDFVSPANRQASLCHITADTSKLGRPVSRGQLIGWATDHVHFNLRDYIGGTYPYSPVQFNDPMGFINCGNFPSNGSVDQYDSTDISCMWPGGVWQGSPTPGPTAHFNAGDTISASFWATDNNSNGLNHVNITIWTASKGWRILPKVPGGDGSATQRFTTPTSQAIVGASFKMPNEPAILSADIYSNNTSYQSAPSGVAFQLSPNGVRNLCLGSVCPQSVAISAATESYETGGGTSGGGGTTPSDNCPPGANQVSVYTDANYQGQCVTKDLGDYATPSAIGLPNDSITSVRVGGGAKATLCRDDNFSNTCEDFVNDDPNLYDNSVNTDTVSSMRVTGGQPTSGCNPTDSQVAFFTGENFSGTCTVRSIGDYNHPSDLGLPNDSIQSIKVGNHVKVMVCRDDNLSNTCEWLENNDSTLRDNSVNVNTISSAQVISRGHVALCSSPNGGGECHWYYAGPTGINYYNMSDQGFNDRAESIYYEPGYEYRYHIVLYVDANQSGALFHADTSVPNLVAPYKDSASSIQIKMNDPAGANITSPANGTKFPSTTTAVDLVSSGGDSTRVHVWNSTYDYTGNWQTSHTEHLSGLVPGTYYWQAQAQDVVGVGVWSTTYSFSINTAPVVFGGTLTLDGGTNQTIQVSAADNELDSLTLNASNLPTWATFTDNHDGTALLSVSPSASTSGQFTINVQANDGELTGTGSVVITVNPVASPPTAALSVSPSTGNAPVTVTANASASTAGTNAISTYAFDFGDGTVVGPQTGSSATHNYTAAGTYTVTVTVTDSANLTSTTTKTVTVNAALPVGSTVVTKQIATTNDDAEEFANGTMYMNSSDLELTCDSSTTPCPSSDPQKQTVGMRFGSLAIPKGATITSAYIELTAKEAQSETTNLTINGQAADNAATFGTSTSNISSRPRTTAAVAWSDLPTWVVGTQYLTPDLSPVVQEIVNRSGWTSGNAMAFIVTGLGHRTPYSYDGSSTYAPRLVVTYTTGTASTNYQAQYFNNKTLTGTPVLSREETSINNDWGGGSPGSGVNVDNFSARWIRTTNFSAGSYTFSVTADDGIRLYIDGALTINQWVDQGATTYTTTKTLAAGNHTIVVEYYENGGGAVAKFSYQLNGTPSPTAPTAALSVTPTSGTAPLAVTANASGSTAGSNNIASYTFNFGDGTTVGPQAGSSASHTYTSPGSYTLTLTVTDSIGLSDYKTQTVTVNSASTNITSGGIYKLVNTNSGKALDVNGGGTSDGTNVQIWTDTNDQLWKIIQNSDGSYKLIDTNSNKALDVNGAGTSDGTNVQIWTDNGSGAQKWQITQNSDGSYKLTNTNSGKVLDVNGAGTSDGTNVQIWTDNGSGAQKWQLTAMSQSPTPPNAALSVTPTSGTAPVTVTANASASTAGTNAISTYSFDFGDGTVIGPQAGSSASHTYAAAGSYTVKVTVIDSTGLAATKSQAVTVSSSQQQSGTQLLPSAWHLSGNNGASELYQSVDPNILAGKTSVTITYDLHGLSALTGDASAIIFDQNGWHYVSLSDYGQNGLNGSQTVTIPLSDFGLDLSQPIDGTLHTRFWYSSAFTVDITSITVQ